MKATRVLVYGDSQLVINQLTGDYQCTSENLALVEKRTLPALAERGMTSQMASAEVSDEVETADTDWRYPIVKYLRDPPGNHERTTRFRARCYLIYQNELYRKGSDGLLLLCPSTKEIKVIMAESHEGVCGAHQSGIKMRWLVRRHSYYWPSILKDCIEYARACIKCQIYGPIQRVPAEVLHPVTKPWPFRGWAVDIIGATLQTSSIQTLHRTRRTVDRAGTPAHKPHRTQNFSKMGWPLWHLLAKDHTRTLHDKTIYVGCANLSAWFSGPRGRAFNTESYFWMRCGLCAGVPARSTVRRVRGVGGGFLGGAPARCSQSDGRMIYGVSKAITGMVLRRLEESRVV
ncbi:unnamed protein product [Prunus brigantina]